MLEILDLEPAHQAVYESLVDNPSQTVADLHASLQLPPPELQRTVDVLAARGLITRLPGTPARYAAIAPDIALEVLFLERERELKRARGYAEQLAARFHHATGGRDHAELVEVVSGRPAVRQRWEQLQRSARSQIRGIDKPPYTVPQPDNVRTECDLLSSGVSYRIIYDTAGLQSFHDWHADIEAAIERGEQARVLSNTPTKLVIADDRLAMIPLQAAPAAIASMVVVHPSGLLEALCALFEDLWRHALPLTSPADVAPVAADRPTPEEARLLSLLATGMPDDAIAKRLGQSHRTFQRRLRALLDRLGADTRFQAGLRASARGWTPSRD